MARGRDFAWTTRLACEDDVNDDSQNPLLRSEDPAMVRQCSFCTSVAALDFATCHIRFQVAVLEA